MSRRSAAVVVLAFIAFISLGLPDGLLGVAWPGIRGHFGLPIDSLGLFLLCATTGYMTSSFFSGPLVRRLGVGGLLTASCAATGTALLAYGLAPAWWVFVSFGLVGGLGAGAIDAGLNTYIDRHHSERLMQWLHASFGVGITIGPVLMTTGIGLTGRWQPGYQVAGAFQLSLAAAFFLTRSLWQNTSKLQDNQEGPAAPVRTVGDATTWESLLHWPSLLGMLLFLTYTGVELGLGLWAYTLLTEARGVDPTVAGLVTGSYWASFTFGRIVAGVWSTRVDARRLVAVGIGLAALPGLAGVVARRFGVNAIPPFLFVDLLLLLAMFLLSHRTRRGAAARPKV